MRKACSSVFMAVIKHYRLSLDHLVSSVGGGKDLRMYWVDYLRKTHILVYVVDSSDRGRLPEAKDELHRLLKADTDLPVVVLGNKQVTKILSS